ncbi:uncharacterized protein LOC131254143 [Magnolia sinica]|uniref:uncharacterized protein LOC131254143 n=1 Tax=Magnolia sinica TaxID=86752 RepID=UPI002658E9B4|nr:uncharacterized protein LOC131254143 [Magnolia sinica]
MASSTVFDNISSSHDEDFKQSENPGLKITSSPLTGPNFLQWQQAVRIFIGGKWKLGHITGTLSCLADGDSKKVEWESDDMIVMSWLWNSMADNVRSGLLFLKTVKEIWDTVHELYSDAHNMSRIFQLEKEIASLQQNDKSLTEYYAKLRSLWEELAYHDEEDTYCSRDVILIKKRQERRRIFKFLDGLNNEYEILRQQIIHNAETMTLNQIFREEYDNLIAQKASLSVSKSMATSSSPMSITSTPASSSQPWVIDTGATDHMTGSVKLANGNLTPITGSGTVPLTSTVSLDKTLLVPGLDSNLLSDLRTQKMFNLAQQLIFFQSLRRIFFDGTVDMVIPLFPFYFFSPTTSSPLLSPHVTPIPFLNSPSPTSPSPPSLSTTPPPPPRRSTRPNSRPLHLQDYVCTQASSILQHRKGRATTSLPPPSSDAPRSAPASALSASPKKGIRTCTFHPIQHFVSYQSLSPSYRTFLANVDSVSIATRVDLALANPHWKHAMLEEMNALEKIKLGSLLIYQSRITKGLTVVSVYVDDIIVTSDDSTTISDIKSHLVSTFEVKDLGSLYYFLSIEIARSCSGISLYQRKYTLDLLNETGMLGCKPVATPLEINHQLTSLLGESLSDPGPYQRLIGRLIYLTITRPDISHAVSVLSQFMHSPRAAHFDAAYHVLRYLKGSPGKGLLYSRHGHLSIFAFSDADWAGAKDDRKSTTGYCSFVGSNLVTWKSKKQPVVARSSAEAEYRAMAHTTYELLWLKKFLTELGFSPSSPMPMMCDNQAAIHISTNPVFHERTKHIEVDCHFIREKIKSHEIITPHVRTGDQLADIFTKPLSRDQHDAIIVKLGLLNIFRPRLRGSVEGTHPASSSTAEISPL